ncbi:acyl-CoA thioesterase [Aestuariibius sp. 2305UL40-4]|uniref:acyl-CoA thioesterase n=1 Tax=Aestuariibius violaceus TaxID=3234132 RepID=UPI00345EC0A0
MKISYLTPLAEAELRQLGIPEPWTYGRADRTRFGELDALAHINNTAYLRWFETFRIHYFRDYGISNYTPEDPRIVLRRVEVDYLAEMLLEEDYVVVGRTRELRTTSFTMDYAIFSGGTLRCTSSAVLVLLEADGTKRPLSDAIRQTLIARDGAGQA